MATSPTQTARIPQCPPLPPPPTATSRTLFGPFEPEQTRTENLSIDCFSTSQRPRQSLGIFEVYFMLGLFECFRVLVSNTGLRCLHRADWVYHAFLLTAMSWLTRSYNLLCSRVAAEAQPLRVARVWRIDTVKT